MKHLKLISMFILGGLVLTGCAVKSPTTAMLEHKEKKVNQTIVEVPKWYKKLPNKKDIIFTARRHAIKFSGNENVKLGVQIKPCRPTISLINVKRPLPLPSNLPKTLRSA